MDGGQNSRRFSTLGTAAGLTPFYLEDSQNKNTPPPLPSIAFDSFKTVIGYNENNKGACFQCHKPGGSASAFFPDIDSFSNENTWIQSKWIVGGDPSASPLFYRMKGSSGSIGPKNMPLGGELHNSQIKIISDWILSLGNPVLIDSDISGIPMRRLSINELKNTYSDLLNFGAPYTRTVNCNFDSIVNQIPVDDLQFYENEDRTISYEHISKHLDLSIAFANCVKNQVYTKFAGGPRNVSCNPNTDIDCRNEFIKNFGRQVFKRPLKPSELSYFEQEFQNALSTDKFFDLITIMLSQPQLYYHFEIEGDVDAQDPNLFHLTPYELAARLSYHFWDAPPDAELRTVANNGTLLNADVYRKQVDRLFSNARTNQTFRNFYGRWLKLNKVPLLPRTYNITEDYKLFAGPALLTNNAYEKIRDPAIEEIYKLTEHYSFVSQGKFSDIFTSPYSFTTSPELSAVYGVPTWTGSHELSELEKVRFPNGKRSGLLTRAALLLASSWKDQPILRGVEIRNRILCDELPPPPPDAEATLEPVGIMTIREKTRIRTSEAKCLGCHQYINPLGFALSDFDALGRYRTQEMILTETRTGGEIKFTSSLLPTNATSIPALSENDSREITGGAQLNNLVATSDKAHSCFTKNYWKYTFGRNLDLSKEQSVYEHLTQKLKEESLQNFFKEIVYQQAFKMRKRKL